MKRWRGTLGLLLVLGLATPGAGETPTGASPVELREITVDPRTEGVAVILRTTGSVKYTASLIDTPTRLVIDLQATYGWRKTPLSVSVGPLRQIRGSQFRKGVARVVLELSRKATYRIEETESGIAVMFDAKPAPVAARQPSPPPAKKIAPAERPSAADPSKTVETKPEAVTAKTPPAESPKGEPVVVERPAGPEVVSPPAVSVPPAPPRPAPVRIAQAQPQAPGPRLISLDFKDADIGNLIRILAAESGKNIVAGEDVKGKVSISLKNVSWELALDTILEARGLQKIERDNVIRIVSTEQLTKEREAKARGEEAKLKSEAEIRAKIAEAQLKEQEVQQRKLAAEAAKAEAEARGPLKEEVIRLAYRDPEDVAKTLIGILGIPPEGTAPVAPTALTGAPPIAEAPFSALYGPQAQQPALAPRSPTAEVLAKGITIRADKATNSIFIRHYAADLERIKKLIAEKLDYPLPQVKIEARMDILDRTALEQIGVQWGGAGMATESQHRLTLVGRGFTSGTETTSGGIGAPENLARRFNQNLSLSQLLPVAAATGLPLGGNLVNLPITQLPTGSSAPGGGISFGFIGAKVNINLVLQALETQGKTRTLARPEIVTVENTKATMSLGEEIPYATVSSAGTQIQFKEALLKLEVTPTVIREGEATRIKMKVVVENNSRAATTVDLGTAGRPPVINRRKAETEVLITEGDRLVIGGVTQGETVSTLRMVPLLGRIPLLGWLFKSREFSETGRELVVFLTPHLIKSAQPQAARPEKK